MRAAVRCLPRCRIPLIGTAIRPMTTASEEQMNSMAWIGLGAMGYPMAANIASRNRVFVWNRNRQVAEKHMVPACVTSNAKKIIPWIIIPSFFAGIARYGGHG